MEDTFFKKIAKDLKTVKGSAQSTKRAKAALKWYREKVKASGAASFGMVAFGKKSITKPLPGQMFSMRYQAKGFENGTLPWYDAAPLYIFLDVNKHGNLLGLNLHYLPPPVRLRVLGFLMGEIGAKVLRHDTKLKASYKRIQAVSQLAPLQYAIKSYIPDRINSKMVRIQPTEWHHAVALPYANFIGASPRKVWSSSGF